MLTYEGLVFLCSLKTRKVYYWRQVSVTPANCLIELYVQLPSKAWKIADCDVVDNYGIDEFLEHAVRKYEHVRGK